MSDETLLGVDLRSAGATLFDPYNPHAVRGASYDVSAGETVILVRSKSEGGPLYLNLRLQRSQEIPPGRVALVQSKELLTVPADVKGRLSGRADFAQRLLFFAGGLVDPGFRGYLWLPIANLNTTSFSLAYEERIVRLELVRIREDVETPAPARETPLLPTPPAEPVLDYEELSKIVRELQAKSRLFEPTTQIVQSVFLAGIAGLTAAFGLNITREVNLHETPVGIAIAALAAVIFGISIRAILGFLRVR